MPFHDSIHEVRIALTIERFDEAVQFYRDRLGLPVPTGCATSWLS